MALKETPIPTTPDIKPEDKYPWGNAPRGWGKGAGSGSCAPGADIPKGDREKGENKDAQPKDK